MYKYFGKRIFDIFASLVGLIFLLPIIIFIGIANILFSKGPLFYTQKRLTKDFSEFNLYKFRSMIVGADTKGPSVTSSDDPRITNIGKIIRKTKIDELPQLLNVLKGDMSLVGPRPEVMKFVSQKKEQYIKVLSVKAGITDLAAIEFRDEEKLLEEYIDKEKAYLEIVLPKKIELYYSYIDSMSFIGDIKLILKTLKII